MADDELPAPKVLIAAGGTGGHLFPAQQLAAVLEGDYQILFAGHQLSESPFFQKERVSFVDISAAPPRKENFFSFLLKTARGLWQSLRLLRRFSPDIVVGFGSYHSFPVLLAAALLRKKIVLFEANAILGKVNWIFSPVAKRIAFQFPSSIKKGVLVPFLPWAKKTSRFPSPLEARLHYGLDPHRPTLLIFGGSQGARFLNEAIPPVLSRIDGFDFQIIHLFGKGQTAPHYSFCPSCVKPFEEDMQWAYAASDLALCRSGAGTVAELVRFQMPALLIPYPFAVDDHQTKNAQFFVEEVRGGRYLLQKSASPEALQTEILYLLQNAPRFRETLKAWNQNRQTPLDFGALVRKLVQPS